MGCDGGTIPRRDEMVKLKKKAEKAERDIELMARWRHCALSGEELKLPVVACDLGRLYNKESLLLALLDKSNMPEITKHIRSLKDVVELKLTPNPSYKPDGKADTYNDVQAAEFVCPVSGLEMSGRYRFAFLRGCGCVFSEKALKEVPSETCHKCGKPFTGGDVVVINGSEEDVKKQREAMEERRRQAKLAKRKRKASPDDLATSSSSSSSDPEKDSPPPEKKPKLPFTETSSSSTKSRSGGPPHGAVPNGLPAGASGKGTSSSKVGSKRGSKLISKLSSSSNAASKLGSGSLVSTVAKKAGEAASAYKTVADDPHARQAYKSLFNSGAEKRSKEQSAHWVTYFPYH